MATGFSTQSDEWPSACIVEEPSKPQIGGVAPSSGSARSPPEHDVATAGPAAITGRGANGRVAQAFERGNVAA